MRTVRLFLVLAVVAAGLMIAPAISDAAVVSTATLVITKVVEGPAPAGTEFTVEVDCPALPHDDQASDEADPEGPFPNPRTVTFTADGGTQSVDLFPTEAPECTVTETDTGGADSVTYAAGDVTADCTVTAGDDSATVSILLDGVLETSCEVIITNTFAEPEPPPVEPPPAAQPAAVTAGLQPAFTG